MEREITTGIEALTLFRNSDAGKRAVRDIRQTAINNLVDSIMELELTPARKETVKAAIRAGINRMNQKGW